MSYSLTKEDVMVLAKKEHIKYEDACKEIETHITLNKQLLEDIDRAGKEIERLHSIIKEAREYVHNHQLVFETSSKKQISDWFDMFYKQLLEILDKGSDKE